MSEKEHKIGRRTLLKSMAALPIVAAAAPAMAATSTQQAGLISSDVCVLAKEVTEGPYYIDPKLVRADITDGKVGIPLEVVIQVVDSTCMPLENARVDIWHCDAQGNYSGYVGQGSDSTLNTEGQTFLRGTQFTNIDGITSFETIYPGWYKGRTTHIHYKVFLDEVTVLTSQLYFPDALSEYIFLNAEAYSGRGSERDTRNGNDSIAQQSGETSFASVKEQSNKYIASLVVGVSADSISTGAQQGFAPQGDRPPGNGTPPNGTPPAGTPNGFGNNSSAKPSLIPEAK
ncbi:MAG: protocatechuate dioxygenase [Hyphomicrobiales bacterium]|nr:MAG: protocatechuate dioxygenase [Hyphomicrobiales bacterium]